MMLLPLTSSMYVGSNNVHIDVHILCQNHVYTYGYRLYGVCEVPNNNSLLNIHLHNE